MNRRLLSLTVCLALVCAPALASGGLRSLEGTPLGELLERFDEARESIETLRADFEELRESGLFAEPVSSSGQILIARPRTILWIYRQPEVRYFFLEGRQMTTWYPERAVAERQDVGRHGKRLRRMLGLGQTSEELVRNHQVSLLARSAVPGASELVLVPRSRRIREYVAEVRLWIDDETSLARQVRYSEPSGDQVTIRLSGFEVNPGFGADELSVPIPPGTVIHETISSLGPLETED